MLHYIIIFFSLLSILILSSKHSLWVTKTKSNTAGIKICLILLFVMSAFKASTVGNDTHEYLRLYEMGNGAITAGTRYELGYLYFSQTIWKMFHAPQALFIVYSLIFYVVLWHFIKKYSSMPWLSVLIFFSYTFFSFSMSALRQSLAIVILFISFDFALKHKYFLFILTTFIATLYHSSAIVFAVCPFLLRLKPSKKIFYIFLGVTLFVYLFFGNILDSAFSYFTYYEHYKEGAYFEGGIRIASVLQLLLSILFLYISHLSYYKLPNDDNSSAKQLFGHLYVFQMVVVSLSILCLKVNILDRMVLYYSCFIILTIPNALSLMSYNKRKFWGTLVLIAVFLYSLFILAFRPEWNSVFPYKFCWNEKYLMIY